MQQVGKFRYILGMERNSQFVGQSGAFLDSVERASRAAPMGRPVLVIGERGTGKELIAERLHQLSQRWAEPLVTLNCAALPETLIEAELFGHEAGAFTGATGRHRGLLEQANGGTLFHAAGGFVRIGILEFFETDHGDPLPCRTLGFDIAAPFHLQTEHHVSFHREPGKQGITLEDHAAVRSRAGHWVAAEKDGPAAGFVQSGDRKSVV